MPAPFRVAHFLEGARTLIDIKDSGAQLGDQGAMARYFFHTVADMTDRDDEGMELKDHARARVEAIKYAGIVMSHEPEVLWDGRDFHVEVSDERGLLLFTVTSHATNAPAAGDTK